MLPVPRSLVARVHCPATRFGKGQGVHTETQRVVILFEGITEQEMDKYVLRI
jgi:hypothetical protein